MAWKSSKVTFVIPPDPNEDRPIRKPEQHRFIIPDEANQASTSSSAVLSLHTQASTSSSAVLSLHPQASTSKRTSNDVQSLDPQASTSKTCSRDVLSMLPQPSTSKTCSSDVLSMLPQHPVSRLVTEASSTSVSPAPTYVTNAVVKTENQDNRMMPPPPFIPQHHQPVIHTQSHQQQVIHSYPKVTTNFQDQIIKTAFINDRPQNEHQPQSVSCPRLLRQLTTSASVSSTSENTLAEDAFKKFLEEKNSRLNEQNSRINQIENLNQEQIENPRHSLESATVDLIYENLREDSPGN